MGTGTSSGKRNAVFEIKAPRAGTTWRLEKKMPGKPAEVSADEWKSALSYAINEEHVALMKKDGSVRSAPDFDEVDYAESLGWTYLGHPTKFLKRV